MNSHESCNLVNYDEIHYPYFLWNSIPLKEEEKNVQERIRSEEEQEKVHLRDPHNLMNHDFVYHGDLISSKSSCNIVTIRGSRMVEYNSAIGAEATPTTSDDEESTSISPHEIDDMIEKSEDNDTATYCVQMPKNSSRWQDVRRVIHILFI